MVHSGIVAQCLAAQGDTAEAKQTFARAVSDAYDHRLYFSALMLAADYIADGGGVSQTLSLSPYPPLSHTHTHIPPPRSQ